MSFQDVANLILAVAYGKNVSEQDKIDAIASQLQLIYNAGVSVGQEDDK